MHIPDIQTSSVRRTHLEPARVPEHGSKHLADPRAVTNIAVGTYQHLAAPGQNLFSLGVQRGTDVDVFLLGLLLTFGINPEIPMVAAADYFSVFSAYCLQTCPQSVFAGLVAGERGPEYLSCDK